MKGVCRFVKQAPYSNPHSIGQTYVELLSHVQNSLVITDPLKSDTYRKYALEGLPIGWFDSYEMFNQLHEAVQTVAKKGIAIDYLTTSLPMAGSENVPVLNKKISDDKENEKILSANYSWLKLTAANYFFGRPHFKNLLKDWGPFENVHVWTHISFMHSKIFYFDRVLASVGSYNFNHSSTDQAYESTTLCMDESLNQKLDQILVQDMVNSLPLLAP
jgi:phosphatidylserine/phosphatidylglycerophosphate/cardiolipin synthase-like enzyme